MTLTERHFWEASRSRPRWAIGVMGNVRVYRSSAYYGPDARFAKAKCGDCGYDCDADFRGPRRGLRVTARRVEHASGMWDDLGTHSESPTDFRSAGNATGPRTLTIASPLGGNAMGLGTVSLTAPSQQSRSGHCLSGQA